MNVITLFTLGLSMLPVALNAQVENSRHFERFVCDGNFFTVVIPSDWDKQEEVILGRQEKQYGVDLTDTKSKSGAFPGISVIYFGPDHLRFKTPEKYVSVSLQTRKKIKGETEAVPMDSTLNGRKIKVFERLAYNLVPAGAAPGMALMYEKRVVMPAKKGFFVLSLRSSEGASKEYLKIFDKVLASFKPNISASSLEPAAGPAKHK